MPEKYFGPEDLDPGVDIEEHQLIAGAFGKYLAAYRADRSGVEVDCDITINPPEVAPGHVRLPHLVAYTDGEQVQDHIMWEVMPRQRAEQWLGNPLPDQTLVESRLPSLLALRQGLREQTLVDTKYDELKARLVGRYVSILFVYQNIDVFKQLWSSEAT